MQIMTLPEVLSEMETANPFSMTFYTYDRRQKTAGRKIEVNNARCTYQKNASRPVSGTIENTHSTGKAPNHFHNATRNLDLENGQIRKVHICLITRFNGKKVVW